MHVAAIAALGTLFTVQVVEKAEIAGARTVIHAAFAEPIPTPSLPPTVVEIEPLPEPDAVQELEHRSESQAEETRPAPMPLKLDGQHGSADLSPLPRSVARLPRQKSSAGSLHSPARSRVTENRQSPVLAPQRPTVVIPREVPVQDKPRKFRTPEIPRQRPVMKDILEMAEADLPTEPAPATPQSLGTTETTPARLLKNPSPVYPADAVEKGIEGLVVLRVTITVDGHAAAVSIAESSGYPSLDQAAREAVRNWQFQPASRDGESVKWTARLPVRFRLR